jgi:hypothetical protein
VPKSIPIAFEEDISAWRFGWQRRGYTLHLASCVQTTDGMGIQRQVLLILALELLDKVDETVIKVLTTQVSVTGGQTQF